MKKLAVIMPAYNAAEYIEASVHSVLSQSYSELKLTVVNDGSTDNTGEILAKLCAEDERLSVLTITNGGPARARNIALDGLSEDTDYIMFVDSDDLLEQDAVEYALSSLTDDELVLMGFRIDGTDGSSAYYHEPEQLISKNNLGTELGRLYKANLLNQVWAKLFPAELIRRHNIRFPDYRWGEDRLFIFSCLEHCEKIRVLPECKYIYVMHKGESLISRYYDRKFDVCLEVDERICTLCESLSVHNEGDFKYMFVKSVFSCLTTLFSSGCPLSAVQKREEIRRIISEPRLFERSRGSFGGVSVRTLCAIIRSGNVTLNAAAFYLVAKLSQLAPKLVMRVKHRK